MVGSKHQYPGSCVDLLLFKAFKDEKSPALLLAHSPEARAKQVHRKAQGFLSP